MYNEEDKKEAKKVIRDILFDKIIKEDSLKCIIDMLKIKLFLRLGLADKIRFYSNFWCGFILVIKVLLGAYLIYKRKSHTLISKEIWNVINLVVIMVFIVTKYIYYYYMDEKNVNVNWAYEQERVTKQWFLKEEYKKWRQFWFWCMIFWFGIYGFFNKFFNEFNFIAWIYPMVFVIPCYEMWIRYTWLTKEEYYAGKFQMQPLDENKKTMLIIQKELTEQLPEGALIGYWANRGEESELTEKELKQILEQDSYEGKLLNEFYERRKDILGKGRELLESTMDILKERSVLFKTAFYKDMDYAFLLPAYLKLIRGQKILLICSTKIEIEEIVCWMQEEIKKMNGMDWWTIGIYRPFREPGNIIAVYHTDFHTFIRDEAYIDFRKKIGFLFLQEPSEYTENCCKEIRCLCSELKNIGEMCMAVSSGTMETLEIVNWGFRENTIYKGQLWSESKNAQVMYWREELSEYNHIYGENFGIEKTLLKYLIEEVHPERIVWIGGRMLPVWDVMWVYKRFCGMDIGEQVVPEEYGYSLQLNEETHIVAEDFLGNYRKMAKLLISRGTSQTMIHIIVPGYLLRDYILARTEDVLIQEGISKKKTVSMRNTVQNIFEELTEKWVSTEWIKMKLEPEYTLRKSLEEYVQELLREYISVETSLKKRILKEIEYYIPESDQIKSWKKKEQQLKIFSDYDGELPNIAIDITFNTIFQKHLPGQNLVLRNKSYNFIGVIEKDEKYMVKVERNSNMVKRKTYYRQIREYKLDRRKMIEQEEKYYLDNNKIEWVYEEGDIIVETKAYISMPTFMDIKNAKKIICKNIPDRKYKRKKYIKIICKDKAKEVPRIIGTWLKEAFYTLCPEDVDYLAVCVQGCTDSISVYNIDVLNEKAEEKDKGEQNREEGYVYIIEDRDKDSGILQDIYEKQGKIINTMRNFMEIINPKTIEPFLQQVK